MHQEADWAQENSSDFDWPKPSDPVTRFKIYLDD